MFLKVAVSIEKAFKIKDKLPINSITQTQSRTLQLIVSLFGDHQAIRYYECYRSVVR